uniref:Uncharacterized protein n=1 Tax=Anguilla anguilla TaxID=7936 RepID=A0A0E9TKY4_ANGAN
MFSKIVLPISKNTSVAFFGHFCFPTYGESCQKQNACPVEFCGLYHAKNVQQRCYIFRLSTAWM